MSKHKHLIIFLTLFSLCVVIPVMASDYFSDYNANQDIEWHNATDEDINQPYILRMNTHGLIEGGWIQADAEDVTIEYNGEKEYITVTYLSGTNSRWRTEHEIIPANSILKKTLWFSNYSGTRNQRWIASGSDTGVLDNSDDLYFTGTQAFVVICDIIPKINPAAPQTIISLPDSWALDMIPGPKYRWQIQHAVGGGSTTAIIPGEIDTKANLLSWYNGPYGQVLICNTDTAVCSVGTIPGFASGIAASTSQVQHGMVDAIIDDLIIRTPVGYGTGPAPSCHGTPTPSPSEWDAIPTAISGSQITMTAVPTESGCNDGIEYYFDEIGGNAGCTDSGWQVNNIYIDEGITCDTVCTYKVKARNAVTGTETLYSVEHSARTNDCGTQPCTNAPLPDPPIWSIEPYAVGTCLSPNCHAQVIMIANTGTSQCGNDVEYYFDCCESESSGVCNDRPWASTTSYTDNYLANSATYCYRFRIRDSVEQGLTTQWSDLKYVYIPPEPPAICDSPPTPDPLTWAVGGTPHKITEDWVIMAATVAYSGCGEDVEYYFDETTGVGGGDDSGWQPQETFGDAGLVWSETYCYRCRARNASQLDLITGWSTEICVSGTLAGLCNTAPTLGSPTWAAEPYLSGTYYIGDELYGTIKMQASPGTSTCGNSIEYYFEETTGNTGGNSAYSNVYYTDGGVGPTGDYTYRYYVYDTVNGQTSEWSDSITITFPSPNCASACTPNPAVWWEPPEAQGPNHIYMTGTNAQCACGVKAQYYFDAIDESNGCSDSGWTWARYWDDYGITSNTTCTYRFRYRNADNHILSDWSGTVSAHTTADVCTDPPMHDPPYWDTEPTAWHDPTSEIFMAGNVSSVCGGTVQYYFDETSGHFGGTDSGWLYDRYYVDTGLMDNTEYTYRYRAREEATGIMTNWSGTASETTSVESGTIMRYTAGTTVFDSAVDFENDDRIFFIAASEDYYDYPNNSLFYTKEFDTCYEDMWAPYSIAPLLYDEDDIRKNKYLWIDSREEPFGASSEPTCRYSLAGCYKTEDNICHNTVLSLKGLYGTPTNSYPPNQPIEGISLTVKYTLPEEQFETAEENIHYLMNSVWRPDDGTAGIPDFDYHHIESFGIGVYKTGTRTLAADGTNWYMDDLEHYYWSIIVRPVNEQYECPELGADCVSYCHPVSGVPSCPQCDNLYDDRHIFITDVIVNVKLAEY